MTRTPHRDGVASRRRSWRASPRSERRRRGCRQSRPPAAAHDATSDVSPGHPARTARTSDVAELDLEYDLLMKSAWLAGRGLRGAPAGADQLAQLDGARRRSTAYVTERFQVAYDDDCARRRSTADPTVGERGERPYAIPDVLDYACDGEPDGAHAVSARCSPTPSPSCTPPRRWSQYDLDEEEGSAVLTRRRPDVTTGEHDCQRLGEFFVLGGEHLLFGLDHVLFLLALVSAPAGCATSSGGHGVHRRALRDVPAGGPRRRVGAGDRGGAGHRALDRGGGGRGPVPIWRGRSGRPAGRGPGARRRGREPAVAGPGRDL